MENESVTLYFREGSSDKVYAASLEARDGGYVVTFHYGRRGGSMTAGTKTATPVDYAKAKKLYDGLVREKRAKGYVAEEGATPFSGIEHAGRDSGVNVQLSNAIGDDDAAALLQDAAWYAQEKIDGHRRAVRLTSDGPIGINRKGLTVALPAPTASAVIALGCGAPTTLDAELVGDVLHVFDLLERDGVDLRARPLRERLDALDALAATPHVRVVATARSAEAKAGLLASVTAAGGEGLVFKRADAPYNAGRPNSGGDSRKLKLVAEATVRVARINEGKRSVVMEVRDGTTWSEVGSVTIPPNTAIPAPGTCIDVRYLYAFRGGDLFQPVYKGVRDELDADDCVVAQLKYKPATD